MRSKLNGLGKVVIWALIGWGLGRLVGPTGRAAPQPAQDSLALLQVQWREAQRLLREGRAGEAEAAFRRILDLIARLPKVDTATHLKAEAHKGLGLALQRQGRVAKALEHFRQALALNPQDEAVYRRLAEGLLELGQYENAERTARAALRWEPERTEAYLDLSAALRGQGRFEAALEAARQALAREPDRAEGHLALAHSLLALRRLAQARQEAQEALRLEPDRAEPLLLLGLAAAVEDNLVGAQYQFRKAVQKEPTNPLTHYLLGLALWEPGHFLEAARHLEAARTLGLSPSQEALAAWLQAQYEQGRPEVGLSRARHLLSRFQLPLKVEVRPLIPEELAVELPWAPPPPPPSLPSPAPPPPEETEVAPEKPETLAGPIAEPLRPFPTEPYNLGVWLLQHGDYEGAAEAFARALEMHPTAEGWLGLGWAQYRQNLLAAATETLQKGLRQWPNHPDLHYALGVVLWERGRRDAAADAFETALQCGLKGPAAQRARQRFVQERGVPPAEDITPAARQAAQRYAQAAREREREGDWRGAIVRYRQALAFNPQDPALYQRLGQACEELDDVAGAVAAYRELVRLRPRDAYAHVRLARALQRLEGVEAALPEYEAAARLAPEDPALQELLRVVQAAVQERR